MMRCITSTVLTGLAPPRRPLVAETYERIAGADGPRSQQPGIQESAPDRIRKGQGPSVWWWQVLGSNQRRLSRRFYRPLPLATRATCRAPLRRTGTVKDSGTRLAGHPRSPETARLRPDYP